MEVLRDGVQTPPDLADCRFQVVSKHIYSEALKYRAKLQSLYVEEGAYERGDTNEMRHTRGVSAAVTQQMSLNRSSTLQQRRSQQTAAQQQRGGGAAAAAASADKDETAERDDHLQLLRDATEHEERSNREELLRMTGDPVL